ncbi:MULTISPECIES: ParA family protein [Brachybacterium]|uniref:Chromosome partitioning protein ParA n=1 Tax=Brachybacterium alimentarium TaxID=47845 RepID=A0A2A3YEZ2_9MICO|nr:MULTISPECIES: ParA family protein [Brachybacterium]PCC30779.1 chromosome partitioning protein ParA [Brachybacterium alimentarium]PCC37857.1 chromosome partitioning protein ParA [Brachybacterium alimentarium]RCS66996.1 ParA family protein [Brachybacterium sp. JB7]RCS68198.1 ParA family protein [Brachybacterium alimentarium]RCS68437.1 ParA family protein [Brachybacterium alimentarium]
MFIVSVCSLKGGVGKTSVTLGLASAALHQEVNTLVIDLDPQGDSTLGLLGEPASTVDIAEVLSSPRTETIDRSILPAPWSADAGSHLDVIPGSSRSSVMDAPSQSAKDVRRLHDALDKRTHQYDLVLIDCPPSLNGLTQMALAASDRALVVAEPGFFAVTAADRALKLASEMHDDGIAPRLQTLGLVVNRYRPRSVEHQYRLAELRELFGDSVLSPVIEERVGLQQAQGGAVPLHRYEGASGKRLTEDFDALLKTVLDSRQHS